MPAKNPLRPYFDKLDKKEDFVPLLQEFIRSSVNEQYASETANDEDNITYGMFYERFVISVFSTNAEQVFKYCASPIERILLILFDRIRTGKPR